jgi:hypothetical protein
MPLFASPRAPLRSRRPIIAVLKLEIHRESDCVGTDERGEIVWHPVFLGFARCGGSRRGCAGLRCPSLSRPAIVVNELRFSCGDLCLVV